jgi:hypothetical protein
LLPRSEGERDDEKRFNIAELERFGNNEREKLEGHDRGFLWRMNSYWRYQQTDGGVIIECESMALSRSIPSLLASMIKPIINSVARESMERTLQSMRTRLLRTSFASSSLQVFGINSKTLRL